MKGRKSAATFGDTCAFNGSRGWRSRVRFGAGRRGTSRSPRVPGFGGGSSGLLASADGGGGADGACTAGTSDLGEMLARAAAAPPGLVANRGALPPLAASMCQAPRMATAWRAAGRRRGRWKCTCACAAPPISRRERAPRFDYRHRMARQRHLRRMERIAHRLWRRAAASASAHRPFATSTIRDGMLPIVHDRGNRASQVRSRPAMRSCSGAPSAAGCPLLLHRLAELPHLSSSASASSA